MWYLVLALVLLTLCSVSSLGAWWNALKTALSEWLASEEPISVTTGISSTVATYYTTVQFAPGLLPTDAFEISGSATKNVKVRGMRFQGTSTANLKRAGAILKRVTANTGGTFLTLSASQADSADPAATAVVKHYTAPPVLGTPEGSGFKCFFLLENGAGTSTEVPELDFTPPASGKPPQLNGVAQSLVVNLGGVTVAGEVLCVSIVWTEE